MLLALVVGSVAGAGAVCRYVVDRVVSHRHDSVFPWGTFLINIVGSFILGLTAGFATHHGLSAPAATVIGGGFCAGFTTFSTWTWETIALAESGAYLEASLNAAVSLVVGLLAAACGLWISS